MSENGNLGLKHYFKVGDIVYHLNNLDTKMEVRKVIRVRSKGGGEEVKVFLIGIECGWWEMSNYRKEVFNAKMLVPIDIVKNGEDKILEWLSIQRRLREVER